MSRRIVQLERKHAAAEDVVKLLYERITALEQSHDAKTFSSGLTVRMQEMAAQQQATEHLYAPLRSDTKAIVDLAAFVRRLLQFDDLGMECSAGVRDAARQALGMPRTETTSTRP
jgi:predicted protein tyrosine phosphatase